MIILKHLTVERFRLLREVDLHFPQRGSILIQGPNESGKSALLESLYFAFYGEPLSLDRKKRWLDDLILYGAANATVSLTFAVGATEMTITRTLERGKGQKASLSIQKLGQPEEGPLLLLASANERIIREIGYIDGEALRNSCLIEQKGLQRLEDLSGGEREIAIRKLLGLERLTRMTEHFKVTAQDEKLLHEASERLRLAEIQVLIPEQSTQLERLEAALDAVTIVDEIAEIEQQEAEIAEQETQLEQIETRRGELKTRQGRVVQLKKADITFADIIAAYEAMAEAKQELPQLEKQIAELERREQEELPLQERRVSELAELMKMFGTLQRMSNDLLSAVDAIKLLEHDAKHLDELQNELAVLTEQVREAQERTQQAQQSMSDLEERRLAGRPALESRLERMKTLAERLKILRQVEEQYDRHVKKKDKVEENENKLRKAQKDLRETEQELALVEAEAKQAHQQSEQLEKRWRQLGMRRQLEEWQRLKGLSQGLADAEQKVRAAHQQQERYTVTALAAKGVTRRHLIILAVCIALFVISALVALLEIHNSAPVAIGAILIALASAGVAGVSFQNYSKARAEEAIADQQMQKAINRVGMMVAAREAAIRMGGSQNDLLQIEHEIQSLGGTIPRSLEEAAYILEQIPDNGESLTDMQKRLQKRRDEANASRNQVHMTMEAVANLHKECTWLEEQRKRDGWENIEEDLQKDQVTLERIQQEIVLLAGQEGLPQSSINARVPLSATSMSFPGIPLTPVLHEESVEGVPALEELVESTIKATEHEMAALNGKLDLVTDLSGQVKIQQEALDILQRRRQALDERVSGYQKHSPIEQLEQARQQQTELRNALQALQDSLRQRVKALGLAFGQTAINSAEAAARKQLEELHIILGRKVNLEAKHASYTALLKERQESLAGHYKQLAKFSNSLGSWIVPPNPFAEMLTGLRTRCQRELQEANEEGIVKELEQLRLREGASRAKIDLCRQEIEVACERIAAMLVQRNRPHPKTYTRADIIAVWPLLEQHTPQDRERLEAERRTLEQELTRLEAQELELSTQLQTGGERLAIEVVRPRKEQQERSYETKKRGNQLVKAVNERLMQKMMPRTEYYMQQLLPLLTSGRYHDVHLTTDTDQGVASGGSFTLHVWDTAAGEYVAKSALSGGAADQLSLALRLAFAIATLPRELSMVPGFLILDEPLSSFDRARAQALVDVVTGEILSQHFEQILLISQSNAFDPAMFPYHIYMDNGVIVESNLPVVQTQVAARQTEPLAAAIAKDEDDGGETMLMSAVTTRGALVRE